MNKVIGTMLLVCAGAGSVYAQAPAAAAPVSKAPSVSQTIKQLEQDWVDAVKAKDWDKLNQIIADDWVSLGFTGKKDTKKSVEADFNSGKNKLESITIGPIDVKVLGNVAVAQGGDTEKSTTDGKDTSGKWVWMDVFVKRDGKWVAVRSQSAKL
jgi:uncharacterized protein (TIGR02246 family)